MSQKLWLFGVHVLVEASKLVGDFLLFPFIFSPSSFRYQSRKKGLFVLARARFQHGINVRKHYQFLEISLMAKTQQIFIHFRCDLETIFSGFFRLSLAQRTVHLWIALLLPSRWLKINNICSKQSDYCRVVKSQRQKVTLAYRFKSFRPASSP